MHNTLSSLSLSRNDYYGAKYLQRLRNEIKRAEKKIGHQPQPSDVAAVVGADDAALFGGNALFQRSLLTSDLRASISDMTLFPSIPTKEKVTAKQQQPSQPQPPVLAVQRQKSTVAHREPPPGRGGAAMAAASMAPPSALRSDEIELPLLSVTKKPVNAYTRETNPRSPLPERRLEYAINLERARTKLSPANLESARSRSRAYDPRQQPHQRMEQQPQQHHPLLQQRRLRRQQLPQHAQHHAQTARAQQSSPAQLPLWQQQHPPQQLPRGSPRDRLVISPSLSLYSDRSGGSAASIEDLAFLTVRGERLTPVSVASLSPAQSPSRTPNEAAAASPLGDGGAAASRDASRQSQLPSPASLAAAAAVTRRSQATAAAAAAASRSAFLPPGQRLLRSPRTVSRRGRARVSGTEWSAAASLDTSAAGARDIRAAYHRAAPASTAVYRANEQAGAGVLHYVEFGGAAGQQQQATHAYARPSPPKEIAPAVAGTRRVSRKRETRTPVARASATATELAGIGGSLHRQRTVVAEAGTQTDADGDVLPYDYGETTTDARARRHAAASAAAAALYAGSSGSGGSGVSPEDGGLLYMLQQPQQFPLGNSPKTKRTVSLLRDSASITYTRPTATGTAPPQPPVDGKTASSVTTREGAQPRLPSIQLVDVKTRKKHKKATIVVKSVVNETNANRESAGGGGRRPDGDGAVHYSRESTIHIDIAIHNADDDFEPSLDLATEALLLALPVQKAKAASGRVRSASSDVGPSPSPPPPPPPPPPAGPSYIPEIRMTSATPPADSGSEA